ncbi:GIY-YIG nuclease family protein [uncultured Polaribacter sp.]|uniref:GIY-YIG nuclease family protein n=1 Tax=uncultured Polaribacter sp. TaxID=174711 RepID=UPI002607A8A0|nr:GIY-YIG nuclease family protein [uncultured Polaribacter sp.]
MKEHIKRRIEYSKDVVPDESTEEFKEVKALHEQRMRENPALKKKLRDNFKKAVNTLEIQDSNGIGLNMDFEIRHFLNEFNHRSWTYGHRKMPIMFNIMEAFVDLDKTINSWKLLEEEDYLISFYDFLDFYTSRDFKYNINFIKGNLEEDLIYNFNVGSEINEITFKTEEGSEFVIAGVSILRRGNEVTMLFLTGEIIDTEEKTKDLVPLTKSRIPGKEEIQPADDRKREAVQLNDNKNLWKVLIACRFDLETETIDARYIAKDEGNSFSILTDDITGFVRNGEWLTKDVQETYEDMLSSVEGYSSIFELAKAVLYLPYYFNFYEEDIEEEEHQTQLKALTNSPTKKRKFKNVDSKYKIRHRSLWLLNRENRFSADRIVLRDENFKIENGGYWKKLSPEEFGTDKKGRQVTGKTWVNKTESYFQANTNDLIISNNADQQEFEGENAGFIYVMRNATFEKDIYKIGLTTNKTEERAKQLSKTSVPDKFAVMREWAVKDCKKAEKEIHEILDSYRVDPRREFFRLDMKIANDTIDKVITEINNNA